MAASNAPVIVKRKKVIAAAGHHGGAWKVAYADFVTAMMAFFMLMWLIGATTENQRKGIADYFNPTIPVNRVSGGGDGAFGGDSIFTEQTLPHSGTGASSRAPTEQNRALGQTGAEEAGAEDGTGEDEAAEEAALREIEDLLHGRGGESMVTDLLARHVTTRLTDEGLIVELFDLDGAPLFAPGTDRAEPVTRELAEMMVRVFGLVRNSLALNGHVQAAPEVLRVNPSWDLSTARAQAMRGLLEQAGFPEARMRRVAGHADRAPATANPMSVRNNRIELVLLRSDQK